MRAIFALILVLLEGIDRGGSKALAASPLLVVTLTNRLFL
jgi:hypothetical protein